MKTGNERSWDFTLRRLRTKFGERAFCS